MRHAFEFTVYYEDTDMAGVVYHANYIKFIERARTEWVRAIGLDQNHMREAGQVFAVRRIRAEYLAPAKFGDALTILTTPGALTSARLTLNQTIARGDAVLFTAEVEIVLLSTAGRPLRLPAEIRQAIC